MEDCKELDIDDVYFLDLGDNPRSARRIGVHVSLGECS